MKKYILLLLIAIFSISGVSLYMNNNTNKENMLMVGVTEGIHNDIMEFVKKNNPQMKIKIVTFNDFIIPNMALAKGDLDLNIYQHLPFLEEQIMSRKYPLKNIGNTVLIPMSVYSTKIKDIQDIKNNGTISIPADPPNRGRALLIIESAGLITLNHDIATPLLPDPSTDIFSNPKNIKFVELEAQMLPRSIDDVDASVINTDWVQISKNIGPNEIIFTESTRSPYVNIIVASNKSLAEKTNLINEFLRAYQSDETKKFVKQKFADVAIAGW